jgi:hypothetical protein
MEDWVPPFPQAIKSKVSHLLHCGTFLGLSLAIGGACVPGGSRHVTLA